MTDESQLRANLALCIFQNVDVFTSTDANDGVYAYTPLRDISGKHQVAVVPLSDDESALASLLATRTHTHVTAPLALADALLRLGVVDLCGELALTL